MAGIITAMDWRVTAAQASQALSEMASGEAYGSLLAVDNTRLLHDAMSDFREANQRTAPAGEIVWLAPAARSTTYQGSLATGATGLTDNETGINGGVELRPSSTLGIGLAAGWRQGAIKSGDFFSATVDTIGAGADVTYPRTSSTDTIPTMRGAACRSWPGRAERASAATSTAAGPRSAATSRLDFLAS
jgi:hypothetical protein